MPILSFKPKLCVNCKYFMKDNVDTNHYGKCLKFPKEKGPVYDLVSGETMSDEEYYYCSTARTFEFMCGKKGNFYKKKYTKNKNE